MQRIKLYQRSLRLIAALTSCLLVLGIMPSAAATTSSISSGNGLKISPVVTNLTISPGQNQTVTVYVQNVTSAPLNLQVVINDFTAGSGENGVPALILNPNQYAPTHSLKRYVQPISNISLQPSEEKQVAVNISIPANVAGGGYYGAVRFIPLTTNGGQTVQLTASVASLILVRVPGNVIDDLRLVGFGAKTASGSGTQPLFFSGNNIQALARFENDGNVQEQPFGKVLLEKGTKEISSYEINNGVPKSNVLPDSIRAFSVNLSGIGSFGKYSLVGNFGFGPNGQLLSGSTTFYVIPLELIIIVLVALLLILFFVFVFPRLLRRYNRQIIRRARRG